MTGFDPERKISRLRQAQGHWARLPLPRRLRVIAKAQGLLAARASAVADELAQCSGRPPLEKLTSEILPLLAAARALQQEAPEVLAERALGRRRRPLWLPAVHTRIRREPCGLILIVGPANYPFFLPGVQAVQAIAAGNAVIIKPGRNAKRPAEILRTLLLEAGMPEALMWVSSEEKEQVPACLRLRVDKVIFTGSTEAGRKVVRLCAAAMVPVVAELSGEDAAIVRADADTGLTRKALNFGCSLNNGNSCIAPRRLIGHPDQIKVLAAAHPQLPTTVARDDAELVQLANASEFALGASIFSRDRKAARSLAAELNAGVVVINDMIVPTADPRIPFGGRGQSGYGLTRGREGLVEMTFAKVIIESRARRRPHFAAPKPHDANLIAAYLAIAYGTGIRNRLCALAAMGKLLLAKFKHIPAQ